MLADLSGRRLLVDGLVVSIAFSAIVIGSIYLNPWLWFEDFPPDIQAMVGAPPEVPVWQVAVLGILFLGTLMFLIVRSTAALLRERDGSGAFALALVHAFLVFQFVNAWDVVVLDWLIFTWWTPSFIVLPGTEGAAGYDDYWFHLRGSYLTPTPWIGSAVFALIAATIASWRSRKGELP